MDDPHDLDEAEDFEARLRELLGTAEVMSILFTRASQSLIIDYRHTETVGPRVMTDEIVASAHDRFLSFGRLRPHLPLPEQLTLAFWTPGSPRVSRYRHVLDPDRTVRNRRWEALVAEAQDSYRFLLKLERQYLCDMVRGSE